MAMLNNQRVCPIKPIIVCSSFRTFTFCQTDRVQDLREMPRDDTWWYLPHLLKLLHMLLLLFNLAPAISWWRAVGDAWDSHLEGQLGYRHMFIVWSIVTSSSSSSSSSTTTTTAEAVYTLPPTRGKSPRWCEWGAFTSPKLLTPILPTGHFRRHAKSHKRQP